MKVLNTDNIKIWHGIIFPREGIYRDGIFKYKILIPKDYPNPFKK